MCVNMSHSLCCVRMSGVWEQGSLGIRSSGISCRLLGALPPKQFSSWWRTSDLTGSLALGANPGWARVGKAWEAGSGQRTNDSHSGSLLK